MQAICCAERETLCRALCSTPLLIDKLIHYVLCCCRALLALCLLAAGAHADEAAAKAEMEKGQSVYLPTTTNDYSGMIYSLLQEQATHLASMDGADVRSSPPAFQSFISLSHAFALVMLCAAAHAAGW